MFSLFTLLQPQLLNHPQFVDIASFAAQQNSERRSAAPVSSECHEDTGAADAALPKERAFTPESQLLAGFSDMLHDARGDTFMVSIAQCLFVTVYTFVRFVTVTRH